MYSTTSSFTLLVLLGLFSALLEAKQKAGNGVDVLYSRAKRQCSCGQSACSCSPVTAIFQISCSCPQTCSCTQTVAPTYPPVTYTMVTTTPAPVIVTTRPTSTSYCCILYVCATGCTYGSEAGVSSNYYYPSSSYQTSQTSYSYPSSSSQLSYYPSYQTSYSYPSSSYQTSCSSGYTSCGTGCCRK